MVAVQLRPALDLASEAPTRLLQIRDLGLTHPHPAERLVSSNKRRKISFQPLLLQLSVALVGSGQITTRLLPPSVLQLPRLLVVEQPRSKIRELQTLRSQLTRSEIQL